MTDISEIKRVVCTYYKISEEDWAKPKVKSSLESQLPRQVFVLTCARRGHSDFAISHYLRRDRSSTRDVRRRAYARSTSDLQFVAAMKQISVLLGQPETLSVLDAAKPLDTAVEIPAQTNDSRTVQEARRLRREGWSYLGLAKRYRVTPQQAAILVGDKPEAAGVPRHG